MASTQNSKDIRASPETLYQAFTNPAALQAWFAPGDMTAKVHRFDLRVGGGYEMSLFYPVSEKEARGKSTDKEDRYTAKFLELTPYERIVQAIHFDSPDAALAEEMIMEVTFTGLDKGTRVTVLFRNIPPGIRPEDNEAGTRLTLEKLARFVR